MYVPLAVGLVAVGVAVATWFRPLPDNKPAPAPTYTDQQVADAKAEVCAAFEKVHKAVLVAGARSGGDDPTAILAVATSSRQVLDVGGRYLLAKLGQVPATPREFAQAVRKLADAYRELTIDYLAEADDAELDPPGQASEEATSTIEGQCK